MTFKNILNRLVWRCVCYWVDFGGKMKSLNWIQLNIYCSEFFWVSKHENFPKKGDFFIRDDFFFLKTKFSFEDPWVVLRLINIFNSNRLYSERQKFLFDSVSWNFLFKNFFFGWEKISILISKSSNLIKLIIFQNFPTKPSDPISTKFQFNYFIHISSPYQSKLG